MQEALHCRAQSPQALHFAVSITGRKSEKREKNPSTVPTGQTVLHQVRPLRQARTTSRMSVAAAISSVVRLRIQTSVR